MYRATLPAAPPFALSLSLRAMAGFAPCTGEQEIRNGAVRKAFSLASGAAVVAEVSEAPGGARLLGHQVPDRCAGAELGVAVSRWLSLADDPAPFLALARSDLAMAAIIAETAGLHQVRFSGLAEGACYFVLAQRTSQALAGARKRRLASAFGPPPLELDGTAHQAFPTLDRLAGLDASELAPFTANQRQAEYLAAVLDRLAGWPPDWGNQVGTDELLAELLSIRGVGEFTARAIALRVLGRLDVVPESLPAFTRAITALYGGNTSMASLVEHYGDQIGLWGYHVRTGLGWLNHPGAGQQTGPVKPARAGSSARTPRSARPHRPAAE
jgi:DNA-3-methyladenine glycosylase II